ncbi:hypothetical protein [Vibrio cincinnatiensis]|uniref:hypothetical protein n=1 Tax=Vibrio cincinnatiensis TaxID=675 RepID=UPI001FA9CD65|nr:hypothetical protein [Vibrio cincinnatiensis]
MDRDFIKKKPLKRTRGRKGLFTSNSQTLLGREANEVKEMVAKMNVQDDPLRLAERYEQAAISYIESFGYEYKTSRQQTIKLSKEERERRLKASNESIREEKNLKSENGPLTIDDIPKEDEVCWWNYLHAESKKQGKHGIRYALDVISITTQIKNGLEKGNYKYLFKLAMRITNCFSIMVLAQYEDKICAGVSRTGAASRAKTEEKEGKMERAIELAEAYRLKESGNPHKKITKKAIYEHIAKKLPVSEETAKRYLKQYFVDSPLK